MKVFCLADGETASSSFSVTVSSDDTVGDLKKLIKAEKTKDFSDFDADKLTLWRVSVPVAAADKNRPIILSEIDSKTELLPTDDLFEGFEGKLPKKTIHIIIQRPLPGM